MEDFEELTELVEQVGNENIDILEELENLGELNNLDALDSLGDIGKLGELNNLDGLDEIEGLGEIENQIQGMLDDTFDMYDSVAEVTNRFSSFDLSNINDFSDITELLGDNIFGIAFVFIIGFLAVKLGSKIFKAIFAVCTIVIVVGFVYVTFFNNI